MGGRGLLACRLAVSCVCDLLYIDYTTKMNGLQKLKFIPPSSPRAHHPRYMIIANPHSIDFHRSHLAALYMLYPIAGTLPAARSEVHIDQASRDPEGTHRYI